MVCGFCVCGTVRPVEILGLAVSMEVTEEGLTAVSLALLFIFTPVSGWWLWIPEATGEYLVERFLSILSSHSRRV